MSDTSMVDRLAALTALADIPREQLAWLVEHGETHELGDGATLYADDTEIVGLIVLVSGRFSVRVDQDGVVREVREVTEGRITGHLPYSRMTRARGYLVADGPVEFVLIRKDRIREMTGACYEFTAVCVHEMLDRVRDFKSDDKRQEKMAALGRLSAGLAHELNNPASAVIRSARALDASLAELTEAARDLGGVALQEASRGAVGRLEVSIRSGSGEPLSAVRRANLEDELIDWLEERDLASDLVDPLAEAGVTGTDLDAVASTLDPGELPVALRYVAAVGSAAALAADITSAAGRIHSLVEAVKKHTHMDRAPAVEPISIEGHLRDTLALMGSRATSKEVSLELSVEPELPAVAGSVAELNQVWMHLVDNAIDAVETSGRVCIEAKADGETVVVRVTDDGPGIAPEDHERVFEPFFTTKDVGLGRGLGLDIVRTVVRAHRGTVDLSSTPGRTEFRIALPVADTPA